MLWSRRSVFLALLVGGAGAARRLLARIVGARCPRVASGSTASRSAAPAIFGLMIWLLYLRFIVPVLGVFYGTSLIADEVDDKTITYLFTRPIPRGAVLLGKYLAYLVCTVLRRAAVGRASSIFLIVPIGGGSIGAAFPVAAHRPRHAGASGWPPTARVFALVGARLKRPLMVGLVFAFGWEPAVLLFPGYLKRLTVAYYLQALVPHAMPQDSAISVLLQVFHEVPPVWRQPGRALAVIIVVALWLAGRAVERREYVLEQ